MIYLTNLDLHKNELQNAVLQPLSTAPSSPKAGQIYYNSADHKIYYYNGSAWVDIGSTYQLPIASDAVLGGVKVGSNLTINSSGVLSGNYSAATTSASGLMSSTDKTKLDGIDTGAQVNVIETVKVNGTALTVTSKAVDVTVPTKTSDLQNNSNFVVDASYVHTDTNFTQTEKTKLAGIAEGANNYSLPIAAANTLGGIKIGTGLNVDPSTGTVSVSNEGMAVGSADKLTTARTIALAGDASGSTSFDGSADVSITVGIASASTSAEGLVQLTDSTSSTSTTTAATPNSVKSAYDLANGKITNPPDKSSGQILYYNGTSWAAENASVSSQTVTIGSNSVTVPDSIDDIAVTDGTYNATTNKLATVSTVTSAIAALPEPMQFKGSLGTDGTITTLPAASSSNEGYVYKVITAGTYASQAADVGDTFISDGTQWVLIPSGDEPSGTVTSVATGTGLTGGPITSSGTISLATSGVTAGTYNSVTVDAYGRVTSGSSVTYMQRYATTITGNASSTNFDVTHNLGTRDVIVQVYVTTSGDDQYDQIMVDVTRTSTSKVTIVFASAPAATETFRVVVIG